METMRLLWMTPFVRRHKLPTYCVISEQRGVIGILVMIFVLPLVMYLITSLSDILKEMLTFKTDTITKFPFLLTCLTIIILLGFLMMPKMDVNRHFVMYLETRLSMFLCPERQK